MALIFATSIPIWRWIGERYSQMLPIVDPRQQLASPVGLFDLGAMLFVWLLSQIAAGVLFSAISGVEIAQLESLAGSQMMLLMLIAGIGQLIAVSMGMVYLFIRYKDTRVIGWYPNFTRADFKLALASFLIAAPVVFIVQMLLSLLVEYTHPAMEAMVKDGDAFTIVAVWLAAVVAAPIAEEVVFRGWIQNWLQRVSFQPSGFRPTIVGGWVGHPDADLDRAVKVVESVLDSESDAATFPESAQPISDNPYAAPHQTSVKNMNRGRSDGNTQNTPRTSCIPSSNWFAIVITSLIFAMMHFGQGLAPIPLFGLSLLLGYLYQRTGSLLPCIGLHMLNNGYSVFWLTMQILLGEPGDLP